MANLPLYRCDIAQWQVHETEDDCDLIVRTNNGRALYCTISPSHFHRSPKLTGQYFKCLHLLRSGEEEQDGFYMEDAYNWLLKLFEPLVAQLAPLSSTVSEDDQPTLSQYLFPPYFVCCLDAADEVPRPYKAETKEHGWAKPGLVVKDDIPTDLNQWAKSYHPSDVKIIYNRLEDVLIKRPSKVVVSGVECHFKRFGFPFGPAHAKRELTTAIPYPPEAWICCLHGVVRDGDKLMGMLFQWINTKGISISLEKLHQNGIIWGDVKAENVLIDREDNAWIIDFGGSYTPAGVDMEIAGTLAGDAEGLAKILDILH
ncbi:uncharacterized protein LY79DRAFT_592789 [Colletotrichum navitas]|uniref:Protein kinase domain-containing protein n=1 Tax=Colletotrichum navitas TaxID=681940 RepID=A0AAD8PT96_9PEZI|nr:uncharacterized protein LY79DRAFT_592789 [Colletotrichum navitas]KAK1579628.1 hypothetical protein LY79DRAFT_592789 [Colletotrichum navitas]